MSNKYDDFINAFKEESNNVSLENNANIIKARYYQQQKDEKKTYVPKLKFNKSLSLALSVFLIFIFVGTIILINNNNSTDKPPVDPVNPPMIETSSDAYAFELMSAANMIYSANIDGIDLSTLTSISKDYSDSTLKEVTDVLNQNLLTMKEILYKDNIQYLEKQSSKEGFEYELHIYTDLNAETRLQYTVYYNKTITEQEKDEIEYNIDGIMIINNKVYEITGTTESEEDEEESTVIVRLNENEKLIIEQEKEDDEVEYVYKRISNSKVVYSYSLSFEDGNELELEFREGSNRGKIKALIKDNIFNLEVNLDNYNGRVIVEFIEGNSVRYTFTREKKEFIKNFSSSSRTIYLNNSFIF